MKRILHGAVILIVSVFIVIPLIASPQTAREKIV